MVPTECVQMDTLPDSGQALTIPEHNPVSPVISNWRIINILLTRLYNAIHINVLPFVNNSFQPLNCQNGSKTGADRIQTCLNPVMVLNNHRGWGGVLAYGTT